MPIPPPRRSPGRPRLYAPADERSRIFVATLEVLRRNSGEEATVSDILAQAGLSTRAFYRHFQTKEDVIQGLYERDARSFGAHLARRVEAADSPESALAIWIYEMLGLAYDRRRAERVAALSSVMVLRVVAGTQAQRVGTESLTQPLRWVLADGRAAGSFPTAEPELDTLTIRAVTAEVISWAAAGTAQLSRRQASEHVLRFCRAALGYGS